ncbi:hypothetical protein NKJ26_15175 [Mesorhizobium sp. M0152]|uniref:hypothetical protein n=1 Tax=Mesorhizobium sp. M0152 TaxID=2956898 RepID=UPI00333DCF96
MGAVMNALVKEILSGVAEMLPALVQRERGPREQLPVDAPNFPKDLEPVIRAEPPATSHPQDRDNQRDQQKPEAFAAGP